MTTGQCYKSVISCLCKPMDPKVSQVILSAPNVKATSEVVCSSAANLRKKPISTSFFAMDSATNIITAVRACL